MQNFFQIIYKKMRQHWFEYLVILCCIAFSAFLMLSTFGYKNHTIVLSLHIWSDFWANIPLIRSFSHGANIPPEYPIFPGERIRYHFLFFLLVGLLEKIGIRLDIAINILSIIGMSGLLIGIFWLGKKLSKSVVVGALSVFFFCFNSSLSWLYYLFGEFNYISYPQGLLTLNSMATHGPYDNHLVSAFWKLNVFTNQRHFALALAFLFISLWGIVYAKKKRWFFLGIALLATLSWMHKAVLLIALIQLGIFLIGKKGTRKKIFFALTSIVLLSLPGIKYLNGTGIQQEQAIMWKLGFLYDATTWKELPFITSRFLRWVMYWGLNWGILPFTALLGWLSIITQTKHAVHITHHTSSYFIPTQLRKTIQHTFRQLSERMTQDASLWFIGGITLFIISNLFSFAGDVATNHKFLNYTQIIFAVFSAVLITTYWKFWTLKPFLIGLCIALTIGGLFDILPLLRDEKYLWPDIAQDEVAQWIEEHTRPQSVFFNTSYTTNSVTITGRKIVFGWDYFTGSIGYDLHQRKELMRPILTGTLPIEEVCRHLQTLNANYILLDTHAHEDFLDVFVNKQYFEDTFQLLVHFPRLSIYDVEHSCQSLP